MPVKLYVGGANVKTQGEIQDLGGYRCFNPAKPKNYPQSRSAITLLDCGHQFKSQENPVRLTCEEVLARQLRWEATAAQRLGGNWRAEALASYDAIIPAKSFGDMGNGEYEVKQTVLAARHLDKQRRHIKPRRLLFGVQGSYPEQYKFCLQEILPYASKSDWIGLGGWRQIGNCTSQLPIFYETIHQCVPLLHQAGICRIHLFGVLYEPAIAHLLWLCDQHYIELSVDNNRPIQDCLRRDLKRSGAMSPYWRENVQLWQERCLNIRSSPYYQEAPRRSAQQFTFWNLNKKSQTEGLTVEFNLLQMAVMQPRILIDGYRTDDPRKWVILLYSPANFEEVLTNFVHWSKPSSHIEISCKGIDMIEPLAAEGMIIITEILQAKWRKPIIYTQLEYNAASSMQKAIAKTGAHHWLSFAGEEFVYLSHKLPDDEALVLPHLSTPKSADDLVGSLKLPRQVLVSKLQHLWRLGLILRYKVERCNGSNEFFYCYQLPATAQFKVWEVEAAHATN
jgi:predicted transcriptional regulator